MTWQAKLRRDVTIPATCHNCLSAPNRKQFSSEMLVTGVRLDPGAPESRIRYLPDMSTIMSM